MADGWGNAVAWSAGTSAASAALAAIFVGGHAMWQHVLFTAFLVIAIVAFVILLGAGLRGSISWLRRSGGRREGPATDPAEATPTIWVQENVAHDQGQAFGVQGGNLIVHQDGLAQSLEKGTTSTQE
jgi:hypothetical protein